MSGAKAEIADALYEIGIIAEVLKGLAAAELGADHRMCSASVDWLAKRLAAQHERIDMPMRDLIEKQA